MTSAATDAASNAAGAAAAAGNVQVFCRFRPLNAKELALGEA